MLARLKWVGWSNTLAGAILIFSKNLPEIYPEYRTVKGDGNCGFRGQKKASIASSKTEAD